MKIIHIGDVVGEAGMNMLNNMLAECSKYLPKLSSEVLAAAKNIEAPGMLADFVLI